MSWKVAEALKGQKEGQRVEAEWLLLRPHVAITIQCLSALQL